LNIYSSGFLYFQRIVEPMKFIFFTLSTIRFDVIFIYFPSIYIQNKTFFIIEFTSLIDELLCFKF